MRSAATTSGEVRAQGAPALDLSAFDAIPSQTTPADRASLLALQTAVAEAGGAYGYLEIGSYLGGTLQPHLLDPRCAVIFSIDDRPAVAPDARSAQVAYPANSTAEMLGRLAAVAPERVERVRCFESDARRIDRAAIAPAPQLCFIDGEHTDAAALSDFAFCRAVAAPDALIAFHDATVVCEGLAAALRGLRREGAPSRAVKLGGSVFAVELGAGRALEHPAVRALASPAAPFLALSRLRRFHRERLGDVGGGLARAASAAYRRARGW